MPRTCRFGRKNQVSAASPCAFWTRTHRGAGKSPYPTRCLPGPERRFPVVNGRDAVNDLLHTLRLDHSNLEDQVKGLVGLIGQFGISDVFMIDVLASEITKFGLPVPTPTPNPVLPKAVVSVSKSLPEYDEAERVAVASSKTIHYRDRHDKMTNAVRLILHGADIKAGTHPDCKFDMNVIGYDGKRDLLIEAKPDPIGVPSGLELGNSWITGGPSLIAQHGHGVSHDYTA